MDIKKAENKVQANLSKLKSIAFQAAVSDGQMSHEERELIKHVEKSLPKLKNLTTEIFEDGHVHAQENYLFQQLLKDLMDEVIEITKRDRKVEYGEQVILKSLRDHMMALLKYMKNLE